MRLKRVKLIVTIGIVTLVVWGQGGNNPPNRPQLISPIDNAVITVRQQIFQVSATDADSDRLKFKIVVMESPEIPPPPERSRRARVWIFDQTQDPSGWSKESYQSGETATLTVPNDRLIPEGKYFWWALAYDGKEWSQISEQRKIRIVSNYSPSAPVLVSPANGEVVHDLIFKIKANDADEDSLKFMIVVAESTEPPSPSRGRSNARVWIFDQTKDSSGWDRENYRSGETATLVVPYSKLIPKGDYLWWALAYDGKEWSQISEKRRMKVVNQTPSIPILVSPPDGATSLAVFKVKAEDVDGDLLKFKIVVSEPPTEPPSPPRGRGSARVWVFDQTQDPHGWDKEGYQSGEVATLFVPSNKPIPNGDYLWWALVFDGREWSEMTEKRRIRISGQVTNYPPSIPTLISPPDGATVSPTPTFKLRAYDPEGDDVKYRIELSSSNSARTYETGFFISGQEATYTVPYDRPLTAGQWVWRVKAIDSKGAQSEWSQSRTFTVGIANNAPSTPVLLSPINQTVFSVPTFKLKSNDPDNDEVMFFIEVRQGSIGKIFQTGFYASGTEVTFSDRQQPLNDGQWNWRAKARDRRNAESNWSEWATFTVISNAPDLVPKDLRVNPIKVTPGGKVTISVKVFNQGKAKSNPSETRIRLSKSADQPSATDPLLARLDTPAIEPNQSVEYNREVTIPVDTKPGDYYVWVIVDANRTAGQSDETNDRIKTALKVEAIAPAPDEKFTATVKVVDESGKPVKNAVVRVFNSEHKPITVKATDANGEVIIRDLMEGYVLRAERKVTTFVLNENGAAVEKERVGANDRLFYEVFLTSDEVKDDGTIDNDIRGRQDTIVLIIKKTNTLIKFHLELAFEWDADKETVDFWIQALRHASNLLYDVTDGHACIGSVTVMTNYRYPSFQQAYTGVPRNAIQVFADNEVHPHVSAISPYRGVAGVHIGREWQGSLAEDWRRRQPELLGSVLAHEFGHSLLLLPDEYIRIRDDKTAYECVKPEIETKDLYGHPDDFRSAVACLMSSPWDVKGAEAWVKASELCNSRPGRHTAKDLEKWVFEEDGETIRVVKKKLAEDCWTRFKRNFEKYSKGRWIIRTPYDRGVDVVPGPVRVVSYTLSYTQDKGRRIDVKDKKDLVGNEMEVKRLGEYQGGQRVAVEILKMTSQKRWEKADARVGIYTGNKFIYQGRTKDGKITIEGYHPGEAVDIFAYDKMRLIDKLPPGNRIEFYPTDYVYQNIWYTTAIVKDEQLNLIVVIPENIGYRIKSVFVQIIVQDGIVLSPREVPLKNINKFMWAGSIPILLRRNRFLELILNFLKTGGYFRLGYETMDGKKSAAAAWGVFGLYSIYKPYPIVGDAPTMRLADGLGYLEAPEAKDGTAVWFVATTPFVFNQANLIPRSFAYTFNVLTGDLGDSSKLYLTFEPIPEMPEGKVLRLYRFSEETRQWQLVDAEVNPEEGVAIISPARAGTYTVMEETPSPPSFTLSAGLSMIGIPFKPSKPTPTDVFGLPANAVRVARWKAEERKYAFYDSDGHEQDPDVASIMPGKGYWVKFDNPVTIPQQGGLLPEEGIAISLKTGWNQIANPFLRPLNWSVDEIYVRGSNDEVKPLSEAVKAGWIEDYAWGWEQDENNPFKGKYVLVYDTSIIPGVKGQLEPWKGYWVYAHQDCELILPPPSATKGRGTRDGGREARRNGWAMKLMAKVGDESGEAILGVLQGSRGLAVGLPPEPPEGNSNVQVIVLKDGAPLAVDVRNSNARQQVWDVLVKFGTKDGGRGTRKEEVTLTWDGIGYAPKDVSLTLVDLSTGTRRYMRTQTAYSFVPDKGETERRFKVIAELGNERPLRIVGLKATPMRGQGVVIEFALTKPAQVQAEVLTLTGRRIALLGGQGDRQAGLHRFIWRGVNGDGAKVSAGVYLVRVQAIDEEGRQVQSVTTVRIRP